MKIIKKNNKVDKKERKEKKEKVVSYSKKEKIFNIVSLVLVFAIGFYYCGRLVFFYVKQNKTMEVAALTLNGSITTGNKTVTEGDGLHQDTDGYYFKGNVFNNYVKFANRLFRVLRVNNDGSIKLVSQDIVTEFMWGDNESYVNSNVDNWLDKKDDKNGSGVYYDTIPYPQDFLVKMKYTIPSFDGKKITNGKDELKSYVTSLSIKDYSNANGKNSFLNIQKYFWLMGQNEEGKNLYVSEDGSLLDGSLYEAYGIRPVITLKKDTQISKGIGTIEDPYIISQGDKTNLINCNVLLGNDVWKVFYDKDNVVKLVYTNYLGTGINYSTTNSVYDPTNRRTLAYYLNNTYYNSLSYKDYLQEFPIFTGEVSSDTSYDFTNIYSTNTSGKVGMLNLFDYHILGGDDYYLSNTTSSVGSMVYVYHNYGLLEETKVSDTKVTIPVIAISRDVVDLNSNKEDPNIYTVR